MSPDAARWVTRMPPFGTGPLSNAHAWSTPRMGICVLGRENPARPQGEVLAGCPWPQVSVHRLAPL
jgi:hypothetical protein